MLEQYGCCKGIEKITPERIENRPGLKALNYRIGTHATFLATMLARLSDLAWKAEDQGTEYRETEEKMAYPLQGLTTRESNDFSIALLDAWATVGDVLTFYQERIANEGYLLTATELRSLLELARLIGYRLKPGISSSVDLAFTLEKGYQVEIPEGTRVQSLPAPGEAAQAFETSYKVKARAEWNEIKARLSQPQSITWAKASAPEEFSIYFQGTALNLKPNQAMLFVFDGESKQALRFIKSAEPQPLQDRTKVTLQKSNPHPMVSESAAMRSSSFLAGSWLNADVLGMATSAIGGIKASGLFGRWTDILLPTEFLGKIRDDQLTGVLPSKEYSGANLGNVSIKVLGEFSGSGLDRTVGASTVPSDPWEMGVYVLRQTASIFGHNAPDFKLTDYTSGTPNFVLQEVAEDPNLIYLDSSYEKLLPESWIVIKGPTDTIFRKTGKVATSITRSNYSITGKTTRIELEDLDWATMLPESDKSKRFDQLRKTVVYAQSEDLTMKLAEEPIETAVDGKTIELDGYYDGLEAGWQMIVSGQTSDEEETAGLTAAERVTVGDAYHGLKTGDYGSPAPELVFDDQEEKDGVVRYSLSVKNWQRYPQELFERLPLSEDYRTIIKIQSFDGENAKVRNKSITLNSPADLKNLWFEMPASKEIFAWENIPEADKARLIQFLAKRFCIDWIAAPAIQKINGKTFQVSDGKYSLSLTLNSDETGVDVKLGEDVIDTFTAEREGEDLKIYASSTPPEFGYIQMKDQITNVTYISNLAPLIDCLKDKYDLGLPAQLLIRSKARTKTSIKYNLLVANWFDYHEDAYTVEIFGDKADSKGEFLYSTLADKSPKNLSSLSLDLAPEISPSYLYIVLTPTPKAKTLNASQKSHISNLASTDMRAFLPGDSPHTTLVLARDLEHSYERETVRIYLNLAHATHGETRREVLGSGDGSLALQQFALRQSPLTYLPAPTPAGAKSTLAVRVNDVLWHETDSLAGLGANDHNFLTRTDDKGKTGIIFGNGQEGSRLPTGLENVTAVYRTGIGKPGNVKAGQIRLLATRPLGVKGVINPLPSSGGVDPEDVFQARRNAPLAVMALDRLVSVQDHEDFARSYAGIGKASATRHSDGWKEVVHLSVAGIDDIPLDQDSDLFKNLFQALHDYGDPRLPVVLDVCERVLLLIKASLRLHPDYLWSSVEPKIRKELLTVFGFSSREPGQDVVTSEVIGAIHRVEGVVYVDLDILDAVSETESLDPAAVAKKMANLRETSGRSDGGSRIVAEVARMGDDGLIKPAQIAYLSPDIPEAIVLKELI